MTKPSPDFDKELVDPRESRSPLTKFILRYRIALLMVIHAGLFIGIYWCAFLMRFTLDVRQVYIDLYWQGLIAVITIKIGVFMWLRSFHGWWRHVSFSDFISLLRSAFVATIVIAAADYFFLHKQIPRIVLLNDLVMTIVVIGGLRSVWRVWDERIVPLDSSRVKERALLILSLIHISEPTRPY